ncbi:hypothetical protein BpHYR1_028990 [Brachionus plicatilis]|uniref:Uncharacterized protein n=1 Tax=Brachionus plicatilis TaxID=10195 RepID=A0A3M7RNS8_BRAPC|nr:hypothetical protein BpHYR1_028990 [Brachionus plicatilis]
MLGHLKKEHVLELGYQHYVLVEFSNLTKLAQQLALDCPAGNTRTCHKAIDQKKNVYKKFIKNGLEFFYHENSSVFYYFSWDIKK